MRLTARLYAYAGHCLKWRLLLRQNHPNEAQSGGHRERF